jgi:hypothetical protein
MSANKRVHTERKYLLSVMIQTLAPSGDAQAILLLELQIEAVILSSWLG